MIPTTSAETAVGSAGSDSQTSIRLETSVFVNATVLCADEDGRALELLHALISSAGFNVVTIASAAVALERIWERLPDLLIIDPTMEDGAGLQMCKQLRAHPETHHILIIFNTVAPPSEEGISNCICTKPLNPSALMDAVRALLRTRP